MSVSKILELVGTSENSWEEAAATAINAARKTLRGPRAAELNQLDMHLA